MLAVGVWLLLGCVFSFPRIISPEGTAWPTELEPWLNSRVAFTGLFGNLLETPVFLALEAMFTTSFSSDLLVRLVEKIFLGFHAKERQEFSSCFVIRVQNEKESLHCLRPPSFSNGIVILVLLTDDVSAVCMQRGRKSHEFLRDWHMTTYLILDHMQKWFTCLQALDVCGFKTARCLSDILFGAFFSGWRWRQTFLTVGRQMEHFLLFYLSYPQRANRKWKQNLESCVVCQVCDSTALAVCHRPMACSCTLQCLSLWCHFFVLF